MIKKYSDIDKVFDLHIDGSHYNIYNIAAGGGCLLDGDTVLDSFVDFVPEVISFHFHEYFGLAHSLSQCLLLGIDHINVQTDCLNLLEDIEKYRKGQVVSDNNLKIISELNIIPMINQFKSFKLKHVPRSQNKLADYLVGNFLDTHISRNKIQKSVNSTNKIYHNDSKFYHSPEKTITKNTLKKISDQIIIFLMFDNVNTMKIKFLHYGSADIHHLVSEHDVTVSSKKWGEKVAKELSHFIHTLNIKEFRVSNLGSFQNKLFDYIRPHSEILSPSVCQELESSYQKFDLIAFSSLTNFTNQVKDLYADEYKYFNCSKIIQPEKTSKTILSSKCKQFLFLTLKTLGEAEDLAQQFIHENRQNEHLKDISHLSIEVIQKAIFDKFFNHVQNENISMYLKQKENFKKNGVKFKF